MVEIESEVLEKSCNAVISLPATDNAQPIEKVIHLRDGETAKRVIHLDCSVKEIEIRTIDSEVIQSISNVKFVPLPEKRARKLMQKKIKSMHPVLAALPVNQLQKMLRDKDKGSLSKKYDACFARANPVYLQTYWNKRLKELWWQTDDIAFS